MYNEERPGFGGFLVKSLLVVLFVFLLMWLFPMPNMKPVYDHLFNENIRSMKDAAKGYFTVERLPKDVGDKVQLTLQEMLNEKMVLPFVDSKGNECDTTASYVELMRMDKEYLLKVNLSCSTKTDYIVEHIGCYDFCPDGCEEEQQEEVEEQIQYQYSRALYKGYKIADGKIKEYEFVKYDQKIDGYEYSCAAGDLKGTKCEIDETKVTYVDAKKETKEKITYVDANKETEKVTTYVDAKKEVKEVISYVDAESKVTYSCPSSAYTLSGTKCTRTYWTGDYTYGSWYFSYTKTSTTALSEYNNGTEKRVFIRSYYTSCNSTCAPHLEYEYNIYRRTATKVMKTETINATSKTTYSCPRGTLEGTRCKIVNYKTEYSCPKGTLEGTKCKIVNYNTKYSCSKGALEGTKCKIVDYNTIYSCSRGNLEGTKCKITDVYKKLIDAKEEAKYISYVSDTTWAPTPTLAGWSATGKSITKEVNNQKIYTGWVTSLPEGYTQVDKKIEYKWSTEGSLKGWSRTGEKKVF